MKAEYVVDILIKVLWLASKATTNDIDDAAVELIEKNRDTIVKILSVVL